MMRWLALEGARNLPLNLFPNPVILELEVRRAFVYRPEKEEVVRAVRFMLDDLYSRDRIEGDCDDASVFLAACLTVLGVYCRFVAIRYGGKPGFRHVFPEWWNGVEWVSMDVTIPAGVIHEEDERMVLYVL